MGITRAASEALARPLQHLSSKLNPPSTSAYEVARVEVCERIFDAGGAKVVLICAPAGFGKTTVMSQLRQRCEAASLSTGWLTVDAADNDVGRFLAAMAAALSKLIPGIAAEVDRTASDGSSFALQLLDRIAGRSDPFLFFLDDFEVVHSSAVIGFVQQIVDHLPRGAQLVVGSRSVPDIGVGRLRAKGWLLEIDPEQLRFSVDEAENFLLKRRRLALAKNDIEQLYRRTDGWPAALWLASLALEHRPEPHTFIASFSGSHAAVAEYLAEDVFARQSAEVRGFLLRSSILSHLTASLCNEVCGIENSGELLERLARANLFLVAAEDAPESYRYHPLFAEFLHSQLARTLPQEVASLHKAAARWYLSQERPVPAIDHALRSEDLDYALPLLSRHAERLLADARNRLLARWFASLPAQSLVPYPNLRSIHVWIVNITRGPPSALEMLESMPDVDELERDPAALMLALRPMLLALVDRFEEAYELGRANLLQLPERAGFARSMLYIQLAQSAITASRFPQARQFIDEARRAQATVTESFGFALSDALEGEIDLLRGHLGQAIRRLQDAVDPKVRDPSRRVKANAMAAVLLAEALYEVDECEAAERFLNVYVPFITGAGLPDYLISGHILLARIAANRGDFERAAQLVKELEFVGHRLELRRIVLAARVERARLLIEQGKLDGAKDELDSAADEKRWQRISALSMIANDVETHQIGVLRWMIRSGRAAQAVPLLAQQLQEAERSERPRRALKLRILTAEALKRADQPSAALRAIAHAVLAAASEGFVRSFVDEGAVVGQLIREWAHAKGGDVDSAGTSIPRTYIERLLGTFQQSEHSEPGARQNVDPPLVEPLTRKEMQVLELLAEGLSNRALAERMFVSEATTRTHLRNINVKFGVHSRVHAIAVARRRGIIP